MIRHEGPTCRVCGTPLRGRDEIETRICDLCADWQDQPHVKVAEAAIGYADSVQRIEDHERWKLRKVKP